MDENRAPAIAAFATYVNLSARELELWLGTEASAAAAAHTAGDAGGQEVLRVLRTPKADLTDDDVSHMRRVVEHVKAEREQRPDGEVTDSAWRHGLMNWGHDPLTWSPTPPSPAAIAQPGRQAPNPRPGDPPAR